ncbi:MAG: hypothetical protein WA962_00895 [Ornithinimicrobium sp.]
MARTVRTRSGVAVAGVVLLTGIAACGSDPEVTEAGDAAAPTSTAPSTSAPEVAVAEPGGDVPAAELVQRLSSPGIAELSSFEFTVDLSDQQEQFAVSGAVDLSQGSPTAQVSMDLPPMGNIELLLVDGTAYVNIPELTPAGKYYEVPAQELANFGVADVSEALDLNTLMQEWDAEATQVTFVGAEEVNGAMTDHYQITLDPQAALDAVGQTAPPDTDLSKSGTYGIWVGEDDLIAQMVLDIEGASATVTMDNWGQDQEVQAPDPADVVQLPNF